MSLKRFFNPRSVAIVGVSENPQKVGHLVARNMIDQGYDKELYFVNPSGATILGKQSFKDLKSIGKSIDLVVLAVPAPIAVSYLERVNQVGCTNVVMFAAGFGETHTPEGDILEKDLLKKAKEYSISVLGPNCIGCINTGSGLNATFFNTIPPIGNISIISQSGALGSAMLDYLAAKTHIGLSHFVSLGNKSVIDESDCLEYFLEDTATDVIGLYLEDVRDGDRFSEILARVSQRKPVIVLKSGRTKEGSQAAMSHTGSMVGDDEIFSSVICEAGGIRADSFAEFQMLLKLYSLGAVPTNRNILVLSNAGGMGVLLADEIVNQKLHLVNVSEDTKIKLTRAFEDTKKITVHNPIDLLGDASAFDYKKAIDLTMKEKDIGGVIVLLTPQANTEIIETAQVLQKVYKLLKFKPLYPIFMGKKSVSAAHSYFEKEGIASFRYFSELPCALAKMCDAREIQSQISANGLTSEFSIQIATHIFDVDSMFIEQEGKPFLNQYDSLKLLEWSGIATAPIYHATSRDDLRLIVEKVGFPLVAKLASDKVTHKTEVKGVITGITVMEELVTAYDMLVSVGGKASGCYLQKEYSGHELIVGAKKDLTFGTVVLVGIGGVYAELIHETMQFVYPFSYPQFLHALSQSKLDILTKEFRGTPSINTRKLYETAMRVGTLFDRFDQIAEIDINPLIVSGDVLTAVDARVICKGKDM